MRGAVRIPGAWAAQTPTRRLAVAPAAESALDDIGLGNWSGEGLEDQGLAFPGAGVVGDADDYLGTLR